MYPLGVGHLYFNFSRPNSFTHLASRELMIYGTSNEKKFFVVKNMYMFEEQEECIWSHMIETL
jgi:collagenase-like PrtC family protease